jgi:hypothetical protein
MTDDILISDRERERVVAQLREHTAEGPLRLEEFGDRSGEVSFARRSATTGSGA